MNSWFSYASKRSRKCIAIFLVDSGIAAALSLHVGIVRGQSLDGVWEITAVIDNGRVVEPTEVLMNYAADGRVVIRGQQVELVVPMTFQRKQLPFMVDTTKSPMTFDMAGAEKTGGRGIFMAGKDAAAAMPFQPRPGAADDVCVAAGFGQSARHTAAIDRWQLDAARAAECSVVSG